MKKIAMTMFAAFMLTTGATSVFAFGNAFEPDSQSNPNVLVGPGDYFYGTIPDFSDTDFFRWHNDTGSDKTYFVYLQNIDNPALDYRVNAISIGGNVPYPGNASLVFDQVGRECWAVFVPANATMDVTVRASTFFNVDPTSRYQISLLSTQPFP